VLSLVELHRAAAPLAEWLGARLDRVVQDGQDRVGLVLSGGEGRPSRDRLILRLCVAQASGRLGVLSKAPAAPERPPAFAQFLKAHFAGGRLLAAETEPDDRILRLRFGTGAGERSLVLQLLGPRSNLFALGTGDIIEVALRPVSDTRRDLALGKPWRLSEGRAPREGEDRFSEYSGVAYLEAVEAHYDQWEQEASENDLTRRILQSLKKERASVERKQRKLEGERAAGQRAEEYRRKGELLKGMLPSLAGGEERVEARDFESGEEVVIDLDPKLSASENLETYFRRHKKAERQLRRAEQEIGATGARLEDLEALEAELSRLREAGEVSAIESFSGRPEVARHVTRFFPAPRESTEKAKKIFRIGKRELPTRLSPKRYQSETGLEIWVGKNDQGNDTLTMKLSRGNDLFFHLEASPGSHVILRTEGSGEPPQEALLEASELAVHFSKQKNSSRANVHVARCKDITKPKGAKPGLVHVHRGKTLSLRRDPERLRRILEARVDD
jgi:predicted ribosome quality control (RQC) complex YloA/Tae2 family protein